MAGILIGRQQHRISINVNDTLHRWLHRAAYISYPATLDKRRHSVAGGKIHSVGYTGNSIDSADFGYRSGVHSRIHHRALQWHTHHLCTGRLIGRHIGVTPHKHIAMQHGTSVPRVCNLSHHPIAAIHQRQQRGMMRQCVARAIISPVGPAATAARHKQRRARGHRRYHQAMHRRHDYCTGILATRRS